MLHVQALKPRTCRSVMVWTSHRVLSSVARAVSPQLRLVWLSDLSRSWLRLHAISLAASKLAARGSMILTSLHVQAAPLSAESVVKSLWYPGHLPRLCC